MKRMLIAAPGLALALALAGCVSAPQGAGGSGPQHSAAGTAAPSPAPASSRAAADWQAGPAAASSIVDTVRVDVYPGGTLRSEHGCGCTLPGTKTELFTAGTPVLLVKITLTGVWKPSQHNRTTQVVTGTTLTGTKFDGRPEQAFLDTADGPAAAAQAHLAWLPGGLFAGKAKWTLPNDRPRSFLAAWYLPPGVDRLLMTVNVPSEHDPDRLTVPLPASVTRTSTQAGEQLP